MRTSLYARCDKRALDLALTISALILLAPRARLRRAERLHKSRAHHPELHRLRAARGVGASDALSAFESLNLC